MKLSPNRIAVYLTAAAGLAAAIAVPLAEMDATSVAGVIGGLGAIALVVHKWLEGWQRHEARVKGGDAAALEEEPLAGAGALPTPTPPRPTDASLG